MKKKILLLLLIVCILTYGVTILCSCVPNDAEFRSVVDCADYLKYRMKDPESFSVYGTCYYVTKSEDGVPTEYIFIPYRAANSYGAYGTDVAMFIDGYYFASYTADESDYSVYGSLTASERASAIMFYSARLAYLEAQTGKYDKMYSAEEVQKGLKKWYK